MKHRNLVKPSAEHKPLVTSSRAENYLRLDPYAFTPNQIDRHLCTLANLGNRLKVTGMEGTVTHQFEPFTSFFQKILSEETSPKLPEQTGSR